MLPKKVEKRARRRVDDKTSRNQFAIAVRVVRARAVGSLHKNVQICGRAGRPAAAMGDNEAAKGLLTLFDATAAAAPVEKKKRAHKPRRPYRCGRCGLPKAGHVCKFRSEQATTGTQTDFTSLQSPVNDLTLLVPRSHSSSDCSATSELSPNDKASGPLPTAVVSERSHSEDVADPTLPESSRPRRVRRPSMRRAASSATVEPADDSSVGSGSQRSRSRSPARF